MKLDYKANKSHRGINRQRRPRRVHRHILAMAVCAVLTFVGYTKFNSSQEPEAEASWSMPGGVMAAYPVLDSSHSNTTATARTRTDTESADQDMPDEDVQTTAANEATSLGSSFQVAALTPIPEAHAGTEPGADSLAEDAEFEILKEEPAESTAATDLDTDWRTVSVKNGDSMALIFKRLGLSPRDLHEIMQLGKVTEALKNLRPGQELLFDIEEQDDRVMLKALQYDPDNLHQLTVQRTEDGYEAELADAELTTRVRAASATINSSLFLAGKSAGMSDNLIMQMVAIYGWDIDFILDIRQGDQFSVIFQETYRDGEKIKDGPIIAAEFRNRDRVLRAVRYVHPDGQADYYSADGTSMRKAFLRTPLDVFRISSHFNPGRKHPVLNRIRAHKGTDYAAPTGTPIKASGDGRIVHIGRKGGYGNAIIIKHGGRYSTLYGHMSRFARRLHNGSRVSQGQVIGYVGSTGLATGPHLHYEFRVDGVHKNPVTVELPKADNVPKKLLADFREHADPMLAELDKLERYDGHLQVADHQVGRDVLLALRGNTAADQEAAVR